MNDVILDARNLHKSYEMGHRSLEVLRGVSLSIERGEFLALRGASGTGKSTLLHLLGGLDTPNSGEVWFNSQNLNTLSNSSLARLRSPLGGQALRHRRRSMVRRSYSTMPRLTWLERR